MGALSKSMKIIDKLSEYVGKGSALIIPVIAIIQFGEVILRYVLGSPTSWSWELATYLYGANFMLSLGWALQCGSHVRTDVLYAKLSEKTKSVLDIITFVGVFLPFVGIMTYKSIEHAIYSVGIREETFSMWSAPIWPLKIVIAVGFTVLLLQGIAKIIRDIAFLAKGVRI